MATYSFKLPDLGEGIVESEISAWHVRVGDTVEEDQVLADVQTDKAIVEVTSPIGGTVLALGCEAGHVLAVGAELVRFELAGDSAPDTGQPQDYVPAPPRQPAAGPAPAGKAAPGNPAAAQATTGVLASPSLRRRAREEGIDLAAVPGSGPRGRISHADLEAFIAAGGELAALKGALKAALPK